MGMNGLSFDGKTIFVLRSLLCRWVLILPLLYSLFAHPWPIASLPPSLSSIYFHYYIEFCLAKREEENDSIGGGRDKPWKGKGG
jgi:hypothetical protein